MKTPVLVSTALLLGILATGCLQSRLQVKGEGGGDQADAPKPVQAQVNDVQPQGQYVIDEIKAEMTKMSGRIEDLERAQKAAPAGATATKEDLTKLDTRMTELEKAQASMIEQFKKMQEQAPPADPAELLEKGKTEFEAGNFDACANTLSDYLKNAKAKKVEEATFLRGDCYYSLKDYKKAIVDYSKFPEKFTKSKRMPQALYKIGLSFEALGMKDDAKGFYQELVEKFPKSPEAKRVKSKTK